MSWFTFQTFHQQISVARFALQAVLLTDIKYKSYLENEFKANKRKSESSFKEPLPSDIDFSGSWI